MSNLKVTRSKARKLIYDQELRTRTREELDNDVHDLLRRPILQKKGDAFALEIENPLLSDHIRAKLKALGHVTDGSFSPSLITLSGVYIYRDSVMGKMLKKDIWINGKCLGESGPDVFFYTEVEGGRTHKIETESEFSPNAMALMAEPGQKYFIRQYIKVGLVVEGAGLEKVSEARGRAAIAKLNMAKTGTCSGSR